MSAAVSAVWVYHGKSLTYSFNQKFPCDCGFDSDIHNAGRHVLEVIVGWVPWDSGAIWPRSAVQCAPEPAQNPMWWRCGFHQQPGAYNPGHFPVDPRWRIYGRRHLHGGHDLCSHAGRALRCSGGFVNFLVLGNLKFGGHICMPWKCL